MINIRNIIESLKNIVISSCAFYPIKFTCIKNVEWTTFNSKVSNPERVSRTSEAWSKDWPNKEFQISQNDYIKNFNWLETWLKNHFNILMSPVVTEKSSLLSESNKVVFKVGLKSSKQQIKKSIEALFKVKVKSVNTLRRKGKTTNFKNIKGKRKDFKHAIITLEEGQSIDVMGGV